MKRCIVLLALLLGSSVAWAAPPTATSKRPRRVELSWTASAGVTGYQVWRRAKGKERWEQVARLNAEATRYVDTRVSDRTTYFYRVELLGSAPDAGHEVGPVTALAPFYLALRSVDAGVASLKVHKWDVGFAEWLESDLYRLKVGEAIGEEQMIADFRTRATLKKASLDPLVPGLARVTYVTLEGVRVTVTSRDKLPLAVLKPKKKAGAKDRSESTRTRPTSRSTSRDGSGRGARTLRFPEPRKAGTAKGTRVRWEISNNTHMTMTVLIQGVTAKRAFQIGPGKTFTARLKRGGNFAVVINASDNAVLSMRGDFGLASGTKYVSDIELGQQGDNKHPDNKHPDNKHPDNHPDNHPDKDAGKEPSRG